MATMMIGCDTTPGDFIEVLRSKADVIKFAIAVPSKIAAFLNFRTRHIAKHLILIDWEIFKNIKFEELSSCGWAWSRTESCAPNVVKFLERFDNITHWTIDTIFSGTTPAMRASVIKKFIKLIQHLHYRNDFQSTYAILFGLQIESIQRLHETWKVSTRHTKHSYSLIPY
ncbi:ras-specific guanine nucleotide-releasing factor RalGPS1 [Trichonephila clavipes]|nr:ras-specific guanine nucleotide-releasing factor RalGPS1 [Trichonephila clavipes]